MKNALILAGMLVMALTGCGEKKVEQADRLLKQLLLLCLPPYPLQLQQLKLYLQPFLLLKLFLLPPLLLKRPSKHSYEQFA